MTAEQRIFVAGAGAVLIVASVGAAASRLFGFQYWLLAGVSLIIYVAVIKGGLAALVLYTIAAGLGALAARRATS